MGIFSFLTKKKGIDDHKFNTEKYKRELMAVMLWKYKEVGGDYAKTKKEALKLKDINLNEAQVDELIERLKHFNKIDSRKNMFDDLVQKCQSLLSAKKHEEAFNLVFNAYKDNLEHIELVELIYQIGDTFKTEEEVLADFDQLQQLNPNDQYNIVYRKGLYLKWKSRFDEAIALFETQNKELKFAWNHYQIAIIENIRGNQKSCIEHLRLTFELDPNLKEDAKNYHELKNLANDEDFIKVVT